MKNTNRDLGRVFLKPLGGRKTEVKGDVAEALLEAIGMVLQELGADKPKELIGFDFVLIDRGDPTLNVSLVDAAALAIASGHKSKKDIANSILKYIESHL